MICEGQSDASPQSIQDICDILDKVLSIIDDETELPKKKHELRWPRTRNL